MRIRPTLSVTLDAGNINWLRSWGPDVSFSRKLDTAVTLLRSQVEIQAEAVSVPKLDLLRRSEALIEAARSGEPADPEDVARLVEAVFEGVD